MFGIESSELAVIAFVALLVIGPKDLPRVLRMVGNWMAKGRAMTRHVRAGFDTMMREAELEEMQKVWAQQNDAIMKATSLPDLSITGPAIDPMTDDWMMPGPDPRPEPPLDPAPERPSRIALVEPDAPESPAPRPRRAKADGPVTPRKRAPRRPKPAAQPATDVPAAEP